jgi:hypothetical protein
MSAFKRSGWIPARTLFSCCDRAGSGCAACGLDASPIAPSVGLVAGVISLQGAFFMASGYRLAKAARLSRIARLVYGASSGPVEAAGVGVDASRQSHIHLETDTRGVVHLVRDTSSGRRVSSIRVVPNAVAVLRALVRG